MINVCGTATGSCGSGVAVCQRDNSYRSHNCGLLNTQSIYGLSSVDPGKGVTVKYVGGDQCSGGPERATTLNIICSADSPGYVADVTEGDCDYTATIYSAAGCGKKVGGGGGLGAGSIILIM